MAEKSVIELKDVAIYHADDPFANLSAKELRSKGHLVLSDINLTVREGEFVYLIGRVGSGKSSLLKTLYAALQLVEGEGEVVGFDLTRLKRRDMPMLRR